MTYPSRPGQAQNVTMAGIPLIDLDTAPPPERVRSPVGGLRQFAPRPLLAVILAVLVLAGLAASTAPRPLLRQVLAAGGTAAAAFELGRDTLYTAHYGSNPNSESAVRRYDLLTGHEVWAVALPQGVQNLVIDDASGVLMARSGTDPRISFLDAATGRVLWTSNEVNTAAITIDGAGVLFTTDQAEGPALRLADPRTGGTIWTRTIGTRVYFGPQLVPLGGAERIVLADAAGAVRVIDFATGAELSTGNLGGPLNPARFPDVGGSLLGTVGDNRLVLRSKTGGQASMTAFSLVPFARLWERTSGPTGLAEDCGEVWCVAGAVPGISALGDPSAVGVSAVDPGTGAPLWTNDSLAFAFRFDGHTVLAGDDQETPEVTLRDQRTGRLLQRLGATVWAGDLLLHPDTEAPGWTWVQTHDQGRVRPVGVVPVAAPFGCEPRDDYLACPTINGPTLVWRIPHR
ncbi:hypothetical protein Acsp02_45860 [Actinoplanes sp. NBRC 103695]|nr:hypothetical protein Acsp02_45860 [Actinoplanes sp. NBRC 103695]